MKQATPHRLAGFIQGNLLTGVMGQWMIQALHSYSLQNLGLNPQI